MKTVANNQINWPTLSESLVDKESEEKKDNDHNEDTFDWEIIPEKPLSFDLMHKQQQFPTETMKHAMSTPNLNHLEICEEEEDDSYTLCSDDVLSSESSSSSCDQQQQPAKQPNVQNNSMKRVPSFKDAILLNADELRNEIEIKKQQKEKARIEALKHRQNKSRSKNIKFVVTPIKRCYKSTGDLKNLVKVEVDDDDNTCGSGGGGGTISSDLILGDSDAAEFYANKGHARVSRNNNRKLRPDEAKRKEMIIYKKNMQRQQQKSKRKN